MLCTRSALYLPITDCEAAGGNTNQLQSSSFDHTSILLSTDLGHLHDLLWHLQITMFILRLWSNAGGVVRKAMEKIHSSGMPRGRCQDDAGAQRISR